MSSPSHTVALPPHIQLSELLEAHQAPLLAACRRAEAQAIPTPFTLFDVRRLRENAAALASVARPDGMRVRVHGAVKAQYLPALLRVMGEHVDGFDVQSLDEMQLLPVDHEVSFHSPVLPDLALRHPRVWQVSLNSVGQYRMAAACSRARDIRWGLRIALQRSVDGQFISSGTKFGVPLESAVEILRQDLPDGARGATFIHHHTHARLHDRADAERVAHDFADCVTEIERRAGRKIHAVNIGGGWDGGFEAAMRGTSASRLLERQLAILSQRLPHVGEVIIEPGRALVEDACVTVTSVVDVIETDAMTYVVVDVGTGFLIPLELARFRFMPVDGEAVRGPARETTVVDGTCSPRGRIGTQATTHRYRPGERVAIFNCGGYTYSLASNFYAQPAPAYALDDGGEIMTILDRERLRSAWNALYG